MIERLIGVITLKAPVYREIADDEGATSQAGMIVALVLLVQGFFGGLVQVAEDGTVSASIMGAVIGTVVTLIVGFIGWFVTAWILAFIAEKMFNGKTSTAEMLRVTGYVQVFGLVSAANVLTLITPMLSCLAGLLGLAVAVLSIIGYMIGVREAAEFSTGNAVITAIIAGVVKFLIVFVIGGTIIGVLVGALALAGGGG